MKELHLMIEECPTGRVIAQMLQTLNDRVQAGIFNGPDVIKITALEIEPLDLGPITPVDKRPYYRRFEKRGRRRG